MRKLFSLLAAVFALQAAPSFALTGGPWSNNDYADNPDVNYQAILRMPNGVGIARWRENSSTQVAIQNSSAVFYKGIVYLGNTYGTADRGNRIVVGMTNGRTVRFSANGQFDTNSSSGSNVNFCNTGWVCKMTRTHPQVRFKGEGYARFFGNVDVETTVTNSTTQFAVDNTNFTVIGQTISQGGENPQLPDLGERVALFVFGSQISFN
ncbi:MAG: hypothetical protein R3F11_11535 [Verrucomicrobiales bacterium]